MFFCAKELAEKKIIFRRFAPMVFLYYLCPAARVEVVYPDLDIRSCT